MPQTPSTVYLYDNGMLMVFDDAGNQIVALQGSADRVGFRLLAAIESTTRLWMGKWNGACDQVELGPFRLAVIAAVDRCRMKQSLRDI